MNRGVENLMDKSDEFIFIRHASLLKHKDEIEAPFTVNFFLFFLFHWNICYCRHTNKDFIFIDNELI